MILEKPSIIKEYTDKGYWREETLLDDFHQNVIRFPEKIALVDPLNKEELIGLKPERITYHELSRAINSVATALVQKGIKKDDVIIMQIPNCWELAMLYLSIARAGAIPSPIPVQWRQKELGYIAKKTEAAAYISVDEFAKFSHEQMGKTLQEDLPTLKHVITLDEVREMIKKDSDEVMLDSIPIDPNDIFFIEWTSGTEADPKGCPMSHNNWYAQSNMFIELYEARMGDVIMIPAPLVNMTGATGLIPWIRTAATLVLHHPFDGTLFIKQLIEEKVNRALLVPAMLVMLLKHPQVDEFDFSSLRTLVTGSAPPSLYAIKEYKKRWGIEIINNWGQNEGTNIISGPVTTPLEERINFPNFGRKDIKWTCESFFRGIETKIIDGIGREVTETGDVGELLYKAPSVIPCYFKQPEMTAKNFENDRFFHTGDLFQIKENHFISYFDRMKDIIIRGGFNISAQEVENMLLGHSKVADAAAVAMPDETMGEKTCVYIVPFEGETVTIKELTDFMKEKGIAVYKLPERLEIVDIIPRNPVGKILKKELREDIKKKMQTAG